VGEQANAQEHFVRLYGKSLYILSSLTKKQKYMSMADSSPLEAL
jgi:hypothetical protein